jgi:hypothetical protein
MIEKIELEDRRDWDDMDYWNWKVLKEELETLNKCEDAFKEMIEEAKSKVPKGSQTEAVLDVLEQELLSQLNSKEKGE